MKEAATVIVSTLLTAKQARSLRRFCARAGLNQPQVIRALLFNLLSTYRPATCEKTTAFFQIARRQRATFDRLKCSMVEVSVTLAESQARELSAFWKWTGLEPRGVISTLVRNLIVTTRPGEAEDAFILTARRLMSKQPSCPSWGEGCQLDAKARVAQACAFVQESSPKLSVKMIAAALRGLGIKRSTKWILRARYDGDSN
jgi:hypothetical protein